MGYEYASRRTRMSDYTETIINKYVWRQFQLAKPTIYAKYTGITPIFPVSDVKAGDTAWGNKPYIVYDSFIRARTMNKYFYPVKCAQIMYSIKGSISEVYEWRDFIFNVLDREDAAAKDINQYAGTTLNNDNFYIHCINASQLKYIGATSQQTGTNKLYSTELVIRYDYHMSDIYNNV